MRIISGFTTCCSAISDSFYSIRPTTPNFFARLFFCSTAECRARKKYVVTVNIKKKRIDQRFSYAALKHLYVVPVVHLEWDIASYNIWGLRYRTQCYYGVVSMAVDSQVYHASLSSFFMFHYLEQGCG